MAWGFWVEMLKLRIVAVGKCKESFYRDAAAEYLKRLSRFVSAEVCELPERASPKEEAADVLRACRGYVVALAVEGKKLSSEGLAESIGRLAGAGREMTFIIGSSRGLDDSVKAKADFLLSFSDMTFPHHLMRVMLLEQIYRAFMINAGSEYHK